MVQPFHLAIVVHDLEQARAFYGDMLGCAEGRSDDNWVDFNFFGHQLVCHKHDTQAIGASNAVDGHNVPVPHFGVVLTMEDWQQLVEQLNTNDVDYIIQPTTRFVGTPGEQAILFIADPSGNVIEFKSFSDLDNLFAV